MGRASEVDWEKGGKEENAKGGRVRTKMECRAKEDGE